MSEAKKSKPVKTKLPKVNFGTQHIKVKDSALVSKVFYDPDTDTLEAVFKNRTRYRYTDVTPKTFAKFVLAESMGKFFNAKIRNKFDYEKVE